MDWFDYLENATCTIKDNDKASKIRSELLTHLEATTGDLLKQGWPIDDARQEALRRMGSPKNTAIGWQDQYAKEYHPGFWVAAWIGLAIGVLGWLMGPLGFFKVGGVTIHAFTAKILIGLTLCSVFALTLLQMGHQSDIRSRWNILMFWVRTNWYCFVAAGIVGLIEGTSALWLYVGGSSMQTFYESMFVVITGFPIVIRLISTIRTGERWAPGLIAIGMGLSYGVFSITIGAILKYPTPVNWGDSFLAHNFRIIPMYTLGVWLPSLLVTSVLKWWTIHARYQKTIS